MRYLLWLLCVAIAAPAFGITPTVDATATVATNATSATTVVTGSATVDGTNRALAVFVQSSDSTPANVTSVVNSCGSASLTQAGTYGNFGTYFRGSLWTQSTQPDTGSCTITVTWAAAQGERLVIAVWFENVQQSARFGTPTQITGTDSSSDITGIAAAVNDLILDCAGFGDISDLGGNWIPASSQTEIAEASTTPNAYDVAACDVLVASSTSQNRTQTSRDNTNTTHSFPHWAIGIAVKEFTGSAIATPVFTHHLQNQTVH